MAEQIETFPSNDHQDGVHYPVWQYEVCPDCFNVLVSPEGDPDMTEEREQEVLECIRMELEQEKGHFEECGELAAEFGVSSCDICGCYEGGARYYVNLYPARPGRGETWDSNKHSVPCGGTLN